MIELRQVRQQIRQQLLRALREPHGRSQQLITSQTNETVTIAHAYSLTRGFSSPTNAVYGRFLDENAFSIAHPANRFSTRSHRTRKRHPCVTCAAPSDRLPKTCPEKSSLRWVNWGQIALARRARACGSDPRNGCLRVPSLPSCATAPAWRARRVRRRRGPRSRFGAGRSRPRTPAWRARGITAGEP